MKKWMIAALLLVGSPGVADETEVQSQLLRAVTVTHDLAASLDFYVGILGQTVIERRVLNADRSSSWLELSADASVTFVVLEGKGEYPGGPVIGGRVAFIGIEAPNAQPRQVERRRGGDTDVILPHRVSNLDEIYRRIEEAGHEVLYPPTVSSTGRSRTMMVFDPNGHIVELFELFPPRKP